VGKNYPIFSPPTPFTHTFLLSSPIFFLHRIMAPPSVTHIVPRPLQGRYQILSRQANSLPNAKFH